MTHLAPDTFKLGDYVYVELHDEREPYWICKIEEIQKSVSCSVQIKVKLFFRRRHVSSELLTIADKYMDSFLHDEEFDWDKAEDAGYNPNFVKLHYKLLQRYVFVSKENLIISPTMIRGKCYVFLLTPVDSPMDVLGKENTFFFLLAHDFQKQEVHEDKGSILIGSKYQVELPAYQGRRSSSGDDNDQLIWEPRCCPERMYAQLTTIARSWLTFKNITNTNSKTRPQQPCRDSHMFGAMEILNEKRYSISKAGEAILKDKTVMTDVLDSWNRDEILIFEKAMGKFGKQFRMIRQEFLPWKSWESIIKFYYHWKGTDKYKIWKQEYHSEQGDIKELDIHVKDWSFPGLTGKELPCMKCSGCSKVPKAPHDSWYSWGPLAGPHRVCVSCSRYWRRYSGFPDSLTLEGLLWDSGWSMFFEVPSSKKFPCKYDTCDKSFKTKATLRRHNALVHENQPFSSVFLCNEEVIKYRKNVSLKTVRSLARKPFQSIKNRN